LGMARTFQIVKPFGELSVLHNVMIAAFNRTRDKSNAEHKAREIINFVGLVAKLHYPASTLNIANLKRLELAKALATEPRLLLLDEVLAGNNSFEREDLVRLIHQTREREVTIIIIGHEIEDMLNLSDRLVVINFGKKIAEGPPIEVVRSKEVIEAYLGEDYEHARA